MKTTLRTRLKVFLKQVEGWSNNSHAAFKDAAKRNRKQEMASRHGEACTLEVVASELRTMLAETKR